MSLSKDDSEPAMTPAPEPTPEAVAAATATATTTRPLMTKKGTMDDLVNMNVSDMTPEQRARFEIKREHEFYSYYEPLRALTAREMDWTDLNSDEAVARHRPTQSSDKALTAFCQLAAIRLKVRRAMIFFFDSTHAYILAEATRTMSLQEDDVFDDDEDALWLGTTKIPRGFSVCEHTVNLPDNGGSNAQGEDAHLVHIINNLTEDTRFCNRPYVVGGPRARFYAGVPITTPNGLKIGAFCALDDKPRDGLNKKELDFLQEMGVAVMSHLEMIKAKVDQKRGNDMVAALSAFTAPKVVSPEDTKFTLPRPRLRRDVSSSSSLPTVGNLRSSSSSTAPKGTATRPAMRRHRSGSKHSIHQSSSDSEEPSDESATTSRYKRSSSFVKNKAGPDLPTYTEFDAIREASRVDGPSDKTDTTTEQTPNQIMQSASALIRQAVDADGVLFLDAAVAGFGNLASNSFLDKTPTNDPDATTSGTDGHQTSEGEEGTSQASDADEQPCAILGSSYAGRHGALPKPEARRDIHSRLTPKFLRSVLRRFKGAKVWNFNENGQDYLDEQLSESQSASDGGSALPTRPSSKLSDGFDRGDRPRSLKRPPPGRQLAAAFPGVLSLMVLGLWDPQRHHWRAACVIWSCTPMRMFSNEGELHYLTAFCDVIMAKLGRLDVDLANSVKSDFISSISHELRSPLHGILGSVEVLQDHNVDHETAELISQIDTCGRTLLDIVDHLLEFSRINVMTQHISSKMRKPLKNPVSDAIVSDSEEASLGADVCLDAITEEVVESAVYSFCCSKDQSVLSDRNVAFSFNIEKHPSIPWNCKVVLGAWKRVCVNLVNNALKYTAEGSIDVSLKILPPLNKLGRPVAQFTVVDTGRGMSKEFLRTKLFRAFSQEDDLTEGTGLGMSMVARIVRGWKGKVDVRSSKGQGSMVSVTMPMKLTRRLKSAETDEVLPLDNTLSGLSVHVLGVSEAPDADVVAKGRHQQLATLTSMCSSMGMLTSGPTWLPSRSTDFAITSESDLPQLIDMLLSPRIQQSAAFKTAVDSMRTKPLVVLCNDYNSARYLRGSRIEQLVRARVEYIAQPCGPYRLSAIIKRILERSEHENSWKSRPLSPLSPDTPRESGTPRFDTWRESHTWSGATSPNETVSTRRYTLQSRRPSDSSIHQHVDAVPAPSKTEAEEQVPNGLGVEESSRKLPEVADGDLIAESSKNIELPALVASRDQSIVSMSSVAADASKPCLLLVDDNPINLQLLVTYAKKNGHAMHKASDGQQAVDAFKNAHLNSLTSATDMPEVILMDLSMPVMDGFEASRQIRAFEKKNRLKPVVIIALTGLGSSEAQHEAFVSGINLFLTKPVRLKELTKLLGTIKDTFGSER